MIPVAKPWLGEEEAAAARDAILSGWVTQGPQVAAFEREFAAYVGAVDACAVSNCTTALHLALVALGIGPGDEVITVSHSFIATANAIRQSGATPVFVDVTPTTFNIDPDAVEVAIGPRTRAVLVVHQIGMPCDLASLLLLADRHGLFLIEDAACAIGSEIAWHGEWQRIGKPHGHVACFSFHPRKVITTGDGGMITARDPGLLARCKSLRQHAMSVSDTARHATNQVIFEHYPEAGFNYRMTDIQASVGRVQLTRLPQILLQRHKLADCYRTFLQEYGLASMVPQQPDWAHSNWQSYCVLLPESVPQQRFMQYLLDAGISTRRGVMCIHREAPYAQAAQSLPISESIQDRGVILPLFHQMTEQDVSHIVATIAAAMQA